MGSVGSSFGLYLYSATSFLTCSALSSLRFLLRHNHSPNNIPAVKASKGMITAIATTAPVPRPPLVLELVPATSAVGAEDVEDEEVDRPRGILVDADGTEVMD